MQWKKCLSGVLALAMIFHSGAVDAFAAEGGQERAALSQTSSEPETVYVNAYGAQERSVSFNDHWRFYLGESSGAEAAAYNDSSWEDVTLPHDYSIDQGFSTAAPAEQESGYVLGGTGWYRKTFTLSEDVEGKSVSVDFDGVYMNATVYLNGKELGTHPYGYTPFSFVLPAESLNYGGVENVLAVKVEHKQPSSRWYSGSGIYRDVKLTITDPVHVAYYGTTVTTPDIEEGVGTVHVAAAVKNDGEEAAAVSVKQTVYELDGTEAVAEGEKTAAQTVEAGQETDIVGTAVVEEPKLWTPDDPNMYTVRTEVYVDDVLTDTYETDFGFRWTEFTLDNGFFLNGKNMKLRGVSMHHDQGGLGSEAWYRSIERQVDILKQMGVNAIRVTHNPAAQVLIDICNRKGVMLVEEAFDCWLSGKAGNTEDYGKWFDEPIEEGNQIVDGTAGEKWAEFDLKAMVKRGRNAPSIIMWSLGNEIFQQTISSSRHNEYPAVARNLITWVGEEDATRYVTFGDNWVKSNVWADTDAVNTAKEFAKADQYGVPGGLVGFNYGSFGQISNGHSLGWLMYGSETASSTNSRGVYDRKASNSEDGKGDKRLTSYDKSCVSWGHLASDALWITMRQDYNAGEFAWTGFDYIGEPTPWNWQGTGANGTWPNIAKNSYFGIIDTAGFPKDSYYLYQSQWNDAVHTLHVLPVWNEEEIVVDGNGKVEVVVYSDAPVVKLYLNGEEVGTATAVHTDTPTGGYQNYTSGTGCFDSSKASGSSSTSLYATFQVPYEEGKLEAKAFEADGTTPINETEGRSFVETTGKAQILTASADRSEISADGKDLSYITIDVTDSDGKFVNGGEPEITVSVTGNGKLLALDNGVQNDVTPYGETTRKAGKGKLLAIVQSTDEAGSFTVKAESPGYATAETTVTTAAGSDNPSGERSLVSYKISKNFYVKEGTKPTLPETVELFYSDDTSETKAVVWEEASDGENSYVVYGIVADLGLRISVNVSVIGQAVDVLNYSTAVGRDAELILPSARPAVMADGTVLAAEFAVIWEIPEDVTAQLGTKLVKGTAQVFDESFEVTAAVRVTNGTYKDGEDALGNVPEMYVNGVSSKESDSVADVLKKLQDDKTGKTDTAWSGRGTLDFRLDTAVELKNMTLYMKDTAPTSDTVKVYSSSDNGTNWTQADCQVTNQKGDGLTIRTYTPEGSVSETWFRVEFTKTTTLLELEMNTRIPSFPIGSQAALGSLKVGGHIADEASLEKGWFGVDQTDLDVDDITAVGLDNASVTILPKDSENVIRILLESEDHEARGIYPVMLGVDNTKTDNASDASRDYPLADMMPSAPSVASSDPLENVKDNNTATIWHSNWGSGTGETDLSDKPQQRYIQIQLKETEKITGLRYLPRSSDKNGIVTKYRVEVSKDGEDWTQAAAGDWTAAVEWKLAQFDAVQAQYIRLYGVETIGNNGNVSNVYMSAAEIRICLAQKELHAGNTTVELTNDSFDDTGTEIAPEPVVTYRETGDADGVTLVKDEDYVLSYRDNKKPGTATVTVTGTGRYAGVVEKEFTIRAVETEVTGYEEVAVTTALEEQPALPGTVIAHTNVGDQLMEVRWDRVGSSALKEYGTFTVYGTVVETGKRISAEVTVSDVIGVQQVTMAIAKGSEPAMPEQVTVYYSNGDTEKKDVAWDLSGADFDTVGIVKVFGTVGKARATASIRVEEAEEDGLGTPYGKNLALNENGASAPTEWPRTLAYISAQSDLAHHTTDGNKDFVSDSSKVIWSDWESGQYHTNASTSIAVNAADRAPFVVTAFGKDGSTSNEDQKKYTVNKVSIGFMEEDGSSEHKVRLPADYKIEYYSGNDGVIAANRLVNSSASECSNTKGWGADNPVKAFSGWTEVTYLGEKPSVPSLDNFKQMIDVSFVPVETTAIRITLTPQAENWTGLEEFEVYYVPVEANSSYTVSSITVDGVEVLGQFDEETKTLSLKAGGGVVEAAATENASVTVLDAVDGVAKVIFYPENGDASKRQEYTIQFENNQKEDSYLISAADSLTVLSAGRAQEGETVTFTAAEGYQFDGTPKICNSSTGEDTGITATNQDGVYRFTMPAYPVTVEGITVAVSYHITYELDGGTAKNPDTYDVETPTFTLNNPEKEGYLFLGWTSDTVKEPTEKMTVVFGTTGDLIFTANWRKGTDYRVTFESNGGTSVPAQEIAAGGKVTEPENPVRRGYRFEGWYRDPECSAAWNFAENAVRSDMALYAKWSEAEILVNTRIPAHLIGQQLNLPGTINITVAEETFDSNVVWNAEDTEAVENATELGRYTVRGSLSELEDRQIAIQVPVSPANIVYFVDCGAAAFTADGQLLVEANQGTIKNSEPDQAYSQEGGWGFTNDPEDLETYGEGDGDAYMSIRNFKSGKNGMTLTYRFALEAGIYDVTAGYYDPWAQYAGDDRHAKITVTDDRDQVLAERADYHISGSKETVEFTDVVLAEDGSLSLNTLPLKSGNNNCDPMISFIAIKKKGDVTSYTVTFEARNDTDATTQQVVAGRTAVRPADPELEGYTFDGWFRDRATTQAWNFDTDTVEENITLYAGWTKVAVPDESGKATLASAIAIAEALCQEDYTEETWQRLTEAVAKAREACGRESLTAQEAKEFLEEISAAVQALELALVADPDHDKLVEDLKNKEQELKNVNAQINSLKAQLTAMQEELNKRKANEGGQTAEPLKKGDSVIVKGVKYRVTNPEDKLAEAYGFDNKNVKNISVAAAVKINGVSCRVTAIADKAFAGMKKLTAAVVGKNVVTIGKQAFKGDSKLRRLTVKSKKLKKVGKNALKGISAKAVIKVPKAKKKAYTGYFKKKGQKKSVKVK